MLNDLRTDGNLDSLLWGLRRATRLQREPVVAGRLNTALHDHNARVFRHIDDLSDAVYNQLHSSVRTGL